MLLMPETSSLVSATTVVAGFADALVTSMAASSG